MAESAADRTKRAQKILGKLKTEYPDAHCALNHRTPFELLAATILSAQCTDVRVNLVTPALFAKYPTARALAAAEPEEVEDLVRSTGFFRNKTSGHKNTKRALWNLKKTKVSMGNTQNIATQTSSHRKSFNDISRLL